MQNDERANAGTAGYQSWRDLLFLHWPVEPDAIQSLLPAGLDVQTYEGRAWLGLVPFSMACIRPWWSPPVPGISWFHETNLRTYVVGPQGESGVWFLSLEANNRLAVAIGRRRWRLNYHVASMSVDRTRFMDSGAAEFRRYQGQRLDGSGACRISAMIDPELPRRKAQAGTLEFFLIERYRLFVSAGPNDFRSGWVHHPPYEFVPATDVEVCQNLTSAAGCPIEPNRPPVHAVYSRGVDVRISPLGRMTLPETRGAI